MEIKNDKPLGIVAITAKVVLLDAQKTNAPLMVNFAVDKNTADKFSEINKEKWDQILKDFCTATHRASMAFTAGLMDLTQEALGKAGNGQVS